MKSKSKYYSNSDKLIFRIGEKGSEPVGGINNSNYEEQLEFR